MVSINVHDSKLVNIMTLCFQVKTELQSYDAADRFSGCDWLCYRWPMPARGDDAKDVFDVCI